MSFSSFDHQCMAEAVALARRGLFSTMPNPRVGCLIARDGQVLGRGWHERAGGPHAERQAIADAKDDLSGATAYVTLEPCSHQGRTGPCADALIDAGISRVVVAQVDPNPEVDGAGLEKLKAAGMEIASGLLETEARRLNPGFNCRMEKGRPWVRVKLAQSLDGRTALSDGYSQWITGSAARKDVQQWRARACAVLTGIGTVLDDDPSLNVRLPGVNRQPLRVIADSHWRTPATAKTLSLDGNVLIAGLGQSRNGEALIGAGAELVELPESDGRVSLMALMSALAEREVNEVHVEAGATLAGALLDAQLIDDLLIYQAPCILGHDGRPAMVTRPLQSMSERVAFSLLERVCVGEDLRMRFRPQYCEN